MDTSELANLRMMGALVLLSGETGTMSPSPSVIAGRVAHALTVVDEVLKQTGVMNNDNG